MKSLSFKCPPLRTKLSNFFFARAPLAPKAAPKQPVLRGAVTRAKEQASWAGSAPNTGRTARTGASMATHWFIAISGRRKEGGGEEEEGGRERIKKGGMHGERMERWRKLLNGEIR